MPVGPRHADGVTAHEVDVRTGPDGGVRELYDRTIGYQAGRPSPFSVWGLAPSLDFEDDADDPADATS